MMLRMVLVVITVVLLVMSFAAGRGTCHPGDATTANHIGKFSNPAGVDFSCIFYVEGWCLNPTDGRGTQVAYTNEESSKIIASVRDVLEKSSQTPHDGTKEKQQ